MKRRHHRRLSTGTKQEVSSTIHSEAESVF